MKHLKFFSFYEKLGINLDMESQVDEYMEIINSSYDKQFHFVYRSDLGNFVFKVILDKNLTHYGEYCPYSRDIILKSKSRSTLLHELKHLDFGIRNKKTLNDITFRANNLSKEVSSISVISNIFYSFTEDEFQAKYHSYYVEFDKHISKFENLETSDVVNEFYKFLEIYKDKTWTWYFNSTQFKFDTYMSDNQISILFKKVINPIINNKSGRFEDDIKTLNEVDTTYLNIGNMLKSYWKKIKILLTGKDLIEMSDKDILEKNRNLKKLESDINRKKIKYKRRMERLVTIMVDKYVK